MILAKRYFLFISFVFIQLAVIPQATAEDKGWFDTFKDNVSETWQQPEHYDLYVPAITWHARFAYDKDKTDRYNERPWERDLVSPVGMIKATGTGCILWPLRIPTISGNPSEDMAGKKHGAR